MLKKYYQSNESQAKMSIRVSKEEFYTKLD
jgi:hypothetical protein